MPNASATTIPLPHTRFRLLGMRRGVMLAIVAAGVWAFVHLGLSPADLWPGAKQWSRIGEFFAAAFSPALTYEKAPPRGTNPLLLKALYAAITTVIFAVAATSISTVVGLLLGFFGSTAWWSDDPVGAAGPVRRFMRKTVRPTVYAVTRIVIALSRSTHELIWAIVFMAAFGIISFTAVIAIAIPYAGTLAKVFSEMIDESPRDAAHAMRAAGARPMQVFLFGLLPRALPDMAAYALYRFECALRSSAILGFFGITTLGFYIKESFTVRHDHEVWTYLYVLIALIVAIDLWSGALRRRLVN